MKTTMKILISVEIDVERKHCGENCFYLDYFQCNLFGEYLEKGEEGKRIRCEECIKATSNK